MKECRIRCQNDRAEVKKEEEDKVKRASPFAVCERCVWDLPCMYSWAG